MIARRAMFQSGVAAAALLLATPTLAQADAPIPVVATFSILGDMVERVGGDKVAVTSLVGPNGDAHVFQPTPADARAVSNAGVLFVNGLEFEGWLDRLIDASDFTGVRVVATDGIEPIAFDDGHDDHDDHASHDHGDAKHADHDHDHDHKDHDDKDHAHDDHDHGHDHGHDDHGHKKAAHGGGHHGHDHGEFDPHAWQSLDNAAIYAANIAEALSKADPDNAALYAANRDAYVAEMKALDAEIRAIVDGITENNRTIITSHDAFQYFGRAYGLTFKAPQGLSTEAEAAAKDVAALIDQIRADGVKAVFVENISDKRLLERIADETGASIGGTLYSDSLSEKDGPAATYLDMQRHNARTLAAALSS